MMSEQEAVWHFAGKNANALMITCNGYEIFPRFRYHSMRLKTMSLVSPVSRVNMI